MRLIAREILLSSMTLLSLAGCANPTAAIRPDVERFKSDNANNVENLQTNFGPLRFASSGNPRGRILLFVHGSPGSWEGWAHFLVNEDLKRTFHMIAVDRPGYGGSGEGRTVSSLATQASQIIEVIKRFKGTNVILVGHSFGGPVVAKMAMLSPELIGGVVFVAASVSPDLEDTKWYQIPATWWPIRKVIPTALRVCNEEIMPLKDELASMLPDWGHIVSKVAIVQGESDPLVPPANVDFLVAHLNPSIVLTVKRVPGLNHFIPWLRPDLIESSIAEVAKASE